MWVVVGVGFMVLWSFPFLFLFFFFFLFFVLLWFFLVKLEAVVMVVVVWWCHDGGCGLKRGRRDREEERDNE